MPAWYAVDTDLDRDRFTAAWGGVDAPTDETGAMLLDLAREQVLTFAPDPGEGEDWSALAPARLVYAQLQQARNLWNAGRAQQDGQIGDGYSFTPRPLDKTIRQIIRPTRGVADVF